MGTFDTELRFIGFRVYGFDPVGLVYQTDSLANNMLR